MKKEFFYEPPVVSVVALQGECIVCASSMGADGEGFIDDNNYNLWD